MYNFISAPENVSLGKNVLHKICFFSRIFDVAAAEQYTLWQLFIEWIDRMLAERRTNEWSGEHADERTDGRKNRRTIEQTCTKEMHEWKEEDMNEARKGHEIDSD